MLSGFDASGQVSECLSHAEAWADLGETKDAKRLLDKAVAVSAGVGSHKDYQMNQWISWLGRAITEDPRAARDHIHWFVQAAVAMAELGLDGASRAADRLLEVVFGWSPQRSVDLFQSFVAEGITGYESGLTALLEAAVGSDPPPLESVSALCSGILVPFQTRDIGNLPYILITRVHQCRGEAQALTCARDLIESVAVWALPSGRPAWRRAVATALQHSRISLAGAGLSGRDLRPEARSSSSVLKVEGEDEPLSTQEVIARADTIFDLIRLRREESPTGDTLDRFDWLPVVVPLVAEADPQQARTLGNAFLAERGDPDVVAECCGRLLALGEDDTARALGLAALTAADDDWRDARQLAKTVLPLLNRDQTLRVAERFRAGSGDALILAECSKRLTALGDTAAARAAAMQALGVSQRQGWDTRWDGGTRIAALQARQLVDPNEGRVLAWQCLIEDITAEYWYPEVTARNLEAVLSVLTETVPVGHVWSEIEEHIEGLFSATPLSENHAPLTADRPADDAPALALAGLLVDHVNHPVTAVAQAAQRACGRLLLRRHAPTLARVRAGLGASEDIQAHLLTVVETVSFEAPDALAGLDVELRSLATSRNYMIRTSAHVICTQLGLALSQGQPDCPVLPAIYRIVLPDADAPSPYALPPASPYRPAPDLPDPLQVVSPFDLQLRALSKRTNIPLENLCRRAVQIMHELRPADEWSADAELHLRNVLSWTGLELPFRRPRCQTAWLAVFHVVSELVDAGLLNPRAVFALGSPFRFYDPDMVLTGPEERPSAVDPIVGRDRFGGHNDEWVRSVSDSLVCLTAELTSEQIVLAEDTILIRAESELPTEVRRSTLSTSGGTEETEEAIASVRSIWRREYPYLGDMVPPELAILRHAPLWYDSPGANWLALNPYLATSLDWTAADDGLFRWLNEDGDVMVETVWWADGLRDHWRGGLHDELGEGWLVVASQSAVAAILGLLPGAARAVTVRRSYVVRDEEVAEVATGVEVLRPV